ncbi:MAG: DoxX family protein [Flavobacterium sp.]|nr:MAG: DoxX family protein [Flavobacterium sp.]
MKALKILRIIFTLFLGGMLILGGVHKFESPSPAPTQMVETIKKGEEVAPNTEVLKIKNYVFGMQQTNYFWQFLGFIELLAGVLLISQVFSLIGAIIALPVTINIFLFHFFLEPNEVGELIQMSALLIINLAIIGFSYKLWKPMLINKTALKFS